MSCMCMCCTDDFVFQTSTHVCAIVCEYEQWDYVWPTVATVHTVESCLLQTSELRTPT